MLCHFFKGNWFAFHEEAREHLLRTLVWCIKRGEKELRVNVVSCFVFIWKFLMSIKGSEEKSHWNSIQELPAYTEFFKDVWLDPLKMTKTMNCVAPGFIILLILLSLLPFLLTLHLCGPVSACRASLNGGWGRGWEECSRDQVYRVVFIVL